LKKREKSSRKEENTWFSIAGICVRIANRLIGNVLYDSAGNAARTAID